ncbi:PLP-dependent transferase [Xylariaceae sp. FL1019]|nr:PLP-dependent transferase [Xylariaceae sp. FL1019]
MDNSSSVFGKTLLKHFDFDPDYRNLNHGSFGTAPRAIREHMKYHESLSEANPDGYIRYDFPTILDESRAAIAQLINTPLECTVFVANASVGVNTVLRNLAWNDDCKDQILYFDTVYGGCGKTIDYVVDASYGRVSSRAINLTYPCEDEEVIKAFHAALDECKAVGKRAKICLFDTVSSLPGVRFPFEEMTKACREAGVLSLIDGAQGVGMIDLDVGALDPDFFFSNCHKWLFTPRSCAVFYVPLRNQHMITSTIPTSHGYVPRTGSRPNPLPASDKSPFVINFEFTGSANTTAYACVKYAIEWRERVLGGEARITQYIQQLARKGGNTMANILGTEILDNKSRSMSQCGMANVALPIDVEMMTVGTRDWMTKYMLKHHNTFIPLYTFHGRAWARVSAQVYLDLDDFEWAGRMLLELCEKAKHGGGSKL